MNFGLLDNPIWFALETVQRDFAVRNALAQCYPSEMIQFGAMEHPTPEGLAAFAQLLEHQTALVWFTPLEIEAFPNCLELVMKLSISQMICQNLNPTPTLEMRELNLHDVPAMLELVNLTKPGPFSARSIELGKFWGVHRNGALVAMAGERLRLTGFTEVSGVCTHPDYRGQGLARALMARVSEQIFARGETPFLHVMGSNTGAVKVYEQLGFKWRKKIFGYVLKAKSSEVKS